MFCRHTETAGVGQLGAAGFLLVLGSAPASDSRAPESQANCQERHRLGNEALSLCDTRREAHLLKHEGKLHPFFRHALHIQETVEFEVQLPLAVVLSFLAAGEPDRKRKPITYVSPAQPGPVLSHCFVCFTAVTKVVTQDVSEDR